MANPHAVVLMAYANVVLKLRITALRGVSAASWWSYFLSMMLDPLTWSALIAAVVTGVLYVSSLRQLELSVVEPLFALVFVGRASGRCAYFGGAFAAAS